MSLIIAQNLTKRFGSGLVFEAVSVQIDERARIGLIGPNGCGKTTLLNALAGVEDVNEGQVKIVGATKIGYLTQESRLTGALTLYEALRQPFSRLLALEERMKALEPQLSSNQDLLPQYDELRYAFETGGGYHYKSRIYSVLKGLQFSDEDAGQPVAHLSGGQAARAALASLLLEEPDLLLLDEPTNHLDVDAIGWLEEYLSRWNKAYVIVSHDRHLLDRLVKTVWAIHHRELRVYSGNYTDYIPQREEALKHQWEAYAAQQALVAKSEDFIRRNIFDKKTTTQAQARRKMLAKLDRVEKPQKERQLSFEIGFPHPSGKRLVRLQDVTVGYPAATGSEPACLFHIDHAILDRGERIALIGPNGSGKTTLLKILTGQLSPLQGVAEWGHEVEYAYFTQTAWDSLDQDITLVEALTSLKGWTISKARDLLGRFLFSGDEVFKKLSQLSGGERSRVALARLAQLGGNLLLLDEPTNHLDIPARETLERVLFDYPGTLLFVSHDRYFVQKLATRIWEINEQTLHIYAGDYDFYLRKKETNAKETSFPTPQPPKAEKKLTPGKLKRLRERKHIKLEQHETELALQVHELDEKIAQLETELAHASYKQNLGEIRQLNERYEQTKLEQERVYAQWAEIVQQFEQV